MQDQGYFDQLVFQQVNVALVVNDATQLLRRESPTQNDLHLRKRQELPANRIAVVSIIVTCLDDPTVGQVRGFFLDDVLVFPVELFSGHIGRHFWNALVHMEVPALTN